MVKARRPSTVSWVRGFWKDLTHQTRAVITPSRYDGGADLQLVARGRVFREPAQSHDRPSAVADNPVIHPFRWAFTMVATLVKAIGNDWVTNLAAMLAYNCLMTIFPLLALLLTIVAIVLGNDPATQHDLAGRLAQALPSQLFYSSSHLGILPAPHNAIDIDGLFHTLASSAGIFGLLSFLGAMWTGSGLFGSMESAFAVIYRTKTRPFMQQKAMTFAMIVIFLILTPVMMAASAVPPILLAYVHNVPYLEIISGGAGLLSGFIVAFILFLAIFMMVPNRHTPFRDAWRGAIVSALLLVLANSAYTIYVTNFARPGRFGGATVGFAILLMLWFWFFSLILLIGAEVNVLPERQREKRGLHARPEAARRPPIPPAPA